MARSIRKELEAVAGVIAEDAVRDGQGKAGVESKSDGSGADPLDRQAAQVDVAAGRSIDRDAGGSRYGHRNAGLADAVVDDADPLGDRDRAIATRVENRQLAIRERLVVRPLKGPARLGAVARVGPFRGRTTKRSLM